MLYKQFHRNRFHLYWSKDGIIENRISIGKLDDILEIQFAFFGNKSRNKKAILEILRIFDRGNLIQFLSQSKSVIKKDLDAVTEEF